MKICDKKAPVKKEAVDIQSGHVYQYIGHTLNDLRGGLYIATYEGHLINLLKGTIYSEDRLTRTDDFRDVTDLVCLDTSRLPPIE